MSFINGTPMGDLIDIVFDRMEERLGYKETNIRRRKKNGTYMADDPNTPENEAWTSGKAPKKKTRRKKQ